MLIGTTNNNKRLWNHCSIKGSKKNVGKKSKETGKTRHCNKQITDKLIAVLS